MKKKVLCLMCVLALCLPACGGVGVDHKESTQPKTSGETTPEPTPTPTLPPDEELLEIGDSATLGDWSITVSDFYFTDKIKNGEFFYFSPEEGSLYAVVSAQVTNNGKESDTFLPSFSTSSDVRATIYYSEEYEYSASVLLMDEDLHNTTLNPLTSKSGIIAFDLPEMMETSEETLSITFTAGRDKVTFSLR